MLLFSDGMGAIQPSHHPWRWGLEGTERARPPSKHGMVGAARVK